MNEYEGVKRILYEDGATFVPVCEKCHRFVKPHESIQFNDILGLKDEPNAECNKCGPTKMLFDGFI